MIPAELFPGRSARHLPPRAVAGTVQRRGTAFAADDEARRSHRAGDDAQDAAAGGGCAFAVDDHFAAVVGFLPGEVVVILDAGDHLGVEGAGDFLVDDLVIRMSVLAHQVHCGPVFAAGIRIEIKPGKTAEFGGEFWMQIHREF